MITDFKDFTDHGSLLTQPVCKGSSKKIHILQKVPHKI